MIRKSLLACVVFSLSSLASASVVNIDCHQVPGQSSVHIWGTLQLNPGNVAGAVTINRSEKPQDMIAPMIGTYQPASKWSPEHVNLTLNFPDAQVQDLRAYAGDTPTNFQSSGRMKGDSQLRPLVCQVSVTNN